MWQTDRQTNGRMNKQSVKTIPVTELSRADVQLKLFPQRTTCNLNKLLVWHSYSGRVVRCRTCDCKVVVSNPANGCCVPTPTQHAIPPGPVNEYQRKLGSKRAYHAMHWPRICGLAASAGVRLRATVNVDQRRPKSLKARERTLLFTWHSEEHNVLWIQQLGSRLSCVWRHYQWQHAWHQMTTWQLWVENDRQRHDVVTRSQHKSSSPADCHHPLTTLAPPHRHITSQHSFNRTVHYFSDVSKMGST